MHPPAASSRGGRRWRITAGVLAATLTTGLAPIAAHADRGSGGGGGAGGDGEESDGGGGGSGKDECQGGAFSLVLPGSTVTAPPGQDLRTTIAANRLGTSFLVRGRYVEFTVNSATLGVSNWTLTGAPNVDDITGGRRTVVFASKSPDLRGADPDERHGDPPPPPTATSVSNAKAPRCR